MTAIAVPELLERADLVDALVAAGLRNREIASQLVVSPKTVEHHVWAILRKLEMPTRRSAAAAAPRLGLSGPPDRKDRGAPPMRNPGRNPYSRRHYTK